jgi:hypothetical protein
VAGRLVYVQSSRKIPHQGIMVAAEPESEYKSHHNLIYISSKWGSEGADKQYTTGTFLTPEDAEELATALLFFAQQVREANGG